MALLPNYEYDVFISYRHKDNKYDGWVTEFVTNLKKEIEATFKEDISIYFDANPHDGLLETHDVDDSLKDKLKCLIFIPIISRTYCDSKSFAWNHEFLAFLKMAASDSIGLKVKLPNGNTASRVLPIRIHELDANDKGMIETELQGVLRAIDFTYKAAGINRPLLSKDDEAIKTSGQATYRDQINKTANAISDIIYGIQGKSSNNAGGFHAEQTLTSSASVLANKKNWKQRFPLLGKLSWSHSVAIVSTLLLFVLAIIHYSETNDIPTYKTTILPPDKTKFDTSRGSSFALSPDGTKLAFVTLDSAGKSLLYVRSLNTLIAKPLNGTEGAQRPFGVGGDGGSWNQDGVILFYDGRAISRVSENGGKLIRVTQIDKTRVDNHRWPLFLPDGKHFLFSLRKNFFGGHEDDAIFVASLDSTFIPKLLVKASSNMAYANGHLIYYDGERLVAQLFDANKLSVSGSPIPIGDQIFFEPLVSNAAFSVSQNGLFVYQSGLTSSARFEYIWHNREGSALGTISSISGLLFRLSPDEERIAVIKEPSSKKEGKDIWLHEINRNV
ncbi:MAG: hypothetical protein NTX25_23560, partial [Proteobacteria bacterium]|nr:hypothetical protein [Pseudomonadota bacterium]